MPTPPDLAEMLSSQFEEIEDLRPNHDHVFVFDKLPRDIKTYLDRYVIQQGEAKKVLSIAVCDHYNHIKQLRALTREDPERAKAMEYVKQNVILIGPTGVGKTYLVKHIAELIGVPFVKADATKFSETGFDKGVWATFEPLLFYVRGELDKAEDYAALEGALRQIEGGPADRTYYFSTADAKTEFDEHPEHYAPIAGGQDVVLLTEKVTKEGSLDHAVWFKGRLYLFTSQKTLEQFVATPKEFAISE